ncbi:hypothetical protein O9993_06200 [Vibrio lentus]|nr:hypothetical protein [Vibrio lentus]
MTGTKKSTFCNSPPWRISGTQITASHSNRNYNGMIAVGLGASPISKNSGLDEIKLHVGTESKS